MERGIYTIEQKEQNVIDNQSYYRKRKKTDLISPSLNLYTISNKKDDLH